MRFLAFLVFLLFCVFMLFARWFFVCKVRQNCEETPVETDIRLKNLKLMQGDTVLLDGYDQFAFDSASVQARMNDNNRLFLDTLARMLADNPDKHLNITSFYRASEEAIQSGFFENIGLARAEEIRKLLMERGVQENRISLDHGISEDQTLSEPLFFEFYRPEIPEAFEKLQFTFTNMTFSDANFEFDSDEFRPGEPFIMYADSVKTYLELNSDKKLTIIGHTDNKGTETYNYGLGMRRAESAREYFKELGVLTPIAIESKGEKVPVTTNQTDSGRQKNRRVNFIME